MKMKLLGATALLVFAAGTALAQTNTGKFGDATVTNAGPGGTPVLQLTTNGPNAFAVLFQTFMTPTLLASISQLSADYQLTKSMFSQGNPRFAITATF